MRFSVKLLFSRWKLDNVKVVKRVVVSVVGATVLLIGIALLVLPGPAFIVIPLGLAILATEYAWARRWLLCGDALIQRRVGAVAGLRDVARGNAFQTRQAHAEQLPERRRVVNNE